MKLKTKIKLIHIYKEIINIIFHGHKEWYSIFLFAIFWGILFSILLDIVN